MTVYLDTSVVVPLFLDDDHATRVRAWAASGRTVALSPWTLTEFSSALSMHVRMSRLTEAERTEIENTFDRWTRMGRMLDFHPDRFDDARRLLQRYHRLRAPDALHLAIATWHRLAFATLDEILAESAVAEGLDLLIP